MKRLFFGVSLFCLIGGAGQVCSADELLRGRVETNWRAGGKRSILMTEFWVPFSQQHDSVLYGDVRLMGDDQDNREGNLGIGYRTITEAPLLGKGVAGAHGWVDRRITSHGSQFHQFTTGAEWLGDDFDLRLNAYLPLSRARELDVPNPDPQAPSFTGTGIVLDTNNKLLEEPQKGFDLELGWNIGQYAPFLDDHTDSVRLYGGFYTFDGSHTDRVTGARARLTADVTENIQVGARFQHDNERGSQGFLEATFRFPFGQKQSYKRSGLRARLDEAPERDIDIVTGSKITDDGHRIAVINNTTGQVQQVLHVDNSAAAGGNGSAEHPYNTLAAAQSAVQAHGIIYVHRGDGTTIGQNAGIVLNKTGQQLIGSGADFYYDGGRFSTANGASPTSVLIASKTVAPVITNAAGDGIRITVDDVRVEGLTVDGSGDDNIDIVNANNVYIANVSSLNAVDEGIVASYYGAASRDYRLDVLDTISNDNGDGGLYVTVSDNNRLGIRVDSGEYSGNFDEGVRLNTGSTALINAVITNNVANNNVGEAQAVGFQTTASDNSRINSVITGNIANGNGHMGFYNYASIDADINTRLESNVSNGNGQYGFAILGNTGTARVQAVLKDNAASGNGVAGLWGQARIDTTLTANVINNSFNNNYYGLLISAIQDGDLGLTLNGNSTSYNNNQGTYLYAYDNATMNATLIVNASNHNSSGWVHGYYIHFRDASSGNVVLNGNEASNNTMDGFLLRTQTASSAVFNLRDNVANNNARNGFYILAEHDSTLETAVYGDSATDNTSNGFVLSALNNAGFSGLVQGVFSSDNLARGIFFDDDSTQAMIADMGGGALGSIGYNSVYGNVIDDLVVDLDGGFLSAENNWWGNSGGLLPGNLALHSGSTVDVSPFLTSAP